MEQYRPLLNSTELFIDCYLQFADIEKSWPNVTARIKDDKIYIHSQYSRPYFKHAYEYGIIYDIQSGKADVWVFSPKIMKTNRNHVNGNGSLCLYDPKDYPPFRRFFLGSQIITWTYEWLNNYEVFLINGGHWVGPEARH